ncbi:MAG TPA: aminodeoxychorismate synthase component I [Rhizomicrobium sp.]|jgi:para-aminobenzoate synthetase/4-amino-4-deoxychorismate lyase
MVCRAVEILLDDARPGRERIRRYVNPIAIVHASDPNRVAPALHILENARRAGKHVAGYFSYELSYVLEPRLRPHLPQERDVPLLWFGIFEACEELTGEGANAALAARIKGRSYGGPLSHEWNSDAYEVRFARLHALIEAGDIYQANLSFRSHFAAVGDPMALYLALREHSQAAYGAFIDDGTRHILSLSPELFFAVSPEREIVAKPMKGTASRGGNPTDDRIVRTQLQTSAKDRAENLMIVDLLRNDLGRVAETGSVSVSDLYAVETYPTVHQMVSTVRARLRPRLSIGALVRALFPCGSVTGAPKIRAMEIIREQEESPRGVYCGAIGHFAPDGSAEFNVAIRTLTIREGRGELGIGGAVVHDSRAASEYDECLLKARYYDVARKPFELIETLRFSSREGFVRRELHLERMARSAATFSIPFDRGRAMLAMEKAISGSTGDQRVRLGLAENGSFSCMVASLSARSAAPWRYVVSGVEMQSSDALLRHKTNWRETYESELALALGCDEVLFVNEHGRLTEGSRTNIFLKRGRRLLTPPLSDGVLGGCLRQALLAERKCEEAELYPGDLQSCDEVFLGNSLRGLIKAFPVKSLSAYAR